MSISAIDAKIKIKGTSITLDIPAIGPSGDHTDGTWDSLDVYDRELFINTADSRLWIGDKEIPMLDPAGASLALPFQLSIIGSPTPLGTVLPTFGTHSNLSDYSSILGGDNITLISSDHSIIGGGYYNLIGTTAGPNVSSPAEADIEYNIIGGGAGNDIINCHSSFIGGGLNNLIDDSNYSSIIGGHDNDTGGFDNVHIIGSSITATADNVTYVEALMNEDSGIISRKKVIEIGDWDMDATATLTVAHGLSSNEWKTIRSITVLVRKDDDTRMYPLDNIVTPTGVVNNGGINNIGPTNVALIRIDAEFFDSTDFNATSYNRGYIYLEYTPG